MRGAGETGFRSMCLLCHLEKTMSEFENCELECGAVGNYCRCRAEKAQAGDCPGREVRGRDPRGHEYVLTGQEHKIERLRTLMNDAKMLIGATNDGLTEAQRESNINKAWHILNEYTLSHNG